MVADVDAWLLLFLDSLLLGLWKSHGVVLEVVLEGSDPCAPGLPSCLDSAVFLLLLRCGPFPCACTSLLSAVLSCHGEVLFWLAVATKNPALGKCVWPLGQGVWPKGW
jgi:hypothetical protein